jgi:hypothetical protein
MRDQHRGDRPGRLDHVHIGADDLVSLFRGGLSHDDLL